MTTSPAKVFVGIPLSDSVHSEFFRTFFSAQYLLPQEGTSYVEFVKWGNVCKNRNDIVKKFLEGDYSHLFFMDSDMRFPEFTLSRLLAHDKDVVGGYYTTKINPFRSTVLVENGRPGISELTYNPTTGDYLKQVGAIATGCMLIKRHVLEGMKWPWFWYRPEHDRQEFASEDVTFCDEARARGFEVWCDFSLCCGHVGHMVVSPFVDAEGAKVRMDAI
jgi:hypothetical protein